MEKQAVEGNIKMANFVYVSPTTVLRYISTISYSLLVETSTSYVSQFKQPLF
jgi:hypothetical protein